MNIDKLSMGRLAVELLLFRSRFPEAAITQASLFANLIERASVCRL
jgi:DNA-binding LacI/PurR family transcriptional regulator